MASLSVAFGAYKQHCAPPATQELLMTLGDGQSLGIA